jgi:hypothetical protein
MLLNSCYSFCGHGKRQSSRWLSVVALVVVASLVFPDLGQIWSVNFKGFDPVSGINLPAQLTRVMYQPD